MSIFRTFRDLFEHEIRDLYSAEGQLTDALMKMARTASNPELRQAFNLHLEETRNHRDRVEKIGYMCGFDVRGETCEAMKGLIREGQQIIDSDNAEPDVLDAALISSAQRVEHYEIAGYGAARSYAHRLGFEEAADLLQQTLDEEKETNGKLNRIAEERINEAAMQH